MQNSLDNGTHDICLAHMLKDMDAAEYQANLDSWSVYLPIPTGPPKSTDFT